MLRSAIKAAEHEENDLVLCCALIRLGELLVETGRANEADPYLDRVLNLDPPSGVLRMEVDRARELLKNRPMLV